MSFIQSILDTIAARLYDHRTIAPGRVDRVSPTSPAREQSVDWQAGVPDLQAGVADPKAPTAGAPVLTVGGGGFYLLLPTAVDDECVGLMSDRPVGTWRATKDPDQVDRLSGLRTGSLSDVMVAPLMITAPEGAPATWSGLTLGGPEGPALELTDLGALTLTKQGAVVATITMADAGSVTIEVVTGQDVKVGGPAATTLAKWAQLDAAMTAMFAAGIAAGTGAPGSTGTAAFTAAQTAWNAAKSGIQTTKAKGE